MPKGPRARRLRPAPVLAAAMVLASVACSDAPSRSSGAGPASAYEAYGRYPPPLDAPPATWPSAAPTGTAVALAPPSAGCGNAAPRTGVLAGRRVAVGKRQRTYTLVVPDAYVPSRAYPLVIALHGNGGTGAGVRAALDLERHARGGALFVYPDAVGGGWDLDSPAGDNADVALFDALLFTIANAHCVDLRRVFVTGFSNGAYMANQLACRRGERIRAIVTHGGGGPYETNGRYDEAGHLLCGGKAVAAMVIHGAADREVAPSEGQKSVDHWWFENRCGRGSSRASSPLCEAFAGCTQPVVSCRVPGLGHGVWPDGKAATWAFFDAQR